VLYASVMQLVRLVGSHVDSHVGPAFGVVCVVAFVVVVRFVGLEAWLLSVVVKILSLRLPVVCLLTEI